MNNYEKRTLSKKTAIIEAAQILFGKQGFTAVSIKDIAALADVSQVSIYNYFGSKEALIGECARVIMQDTIALAEEILASEGTFTQKLERAIQLCNVEINLSLSKFISKEASKDQQFLI
ncbi:TetR/AcrR family transcriptional regulator, partial [Listeria monocytogenes]|nr:TetR/AcrR family transcriptional regulator [Listeria monocytogenes]